MPVAAPLATQLQGTASGIPYALYVAGLDVMGSVPVDTIHVTEEGPGGVSAMEFHVDDPDKLYKFLDGQRVQFRDRINDIYLFQGYVADWSVEPAFGQQGRYWKVSADGVEQWLDWLIVPDMAGTGLFWGSSTFSYSIGQIANSLVSPLWIRRQTGGGSYGTTLLGIAEHLGADATATTSSGGALPTTPGTLRETIAVWATGYSNSVDPFLPYGIDIQLTVDFNLTLRVWNSANPITGVLHQPDDYTSLTIVNTPIGARRSEDLTFAVSPGDLSHEVYIKGGNAAGSGYFSDGTGIQTRQGLIEDATILTADVALARARAFLAGQNLSIRSTLEIQDWTPPTTVHAGGIVDLTDAATGSTGTYRIFSIDKDFHDGGRQDWTVHFGGFRRSGVRRVASRVRRVELKGII